MRRGIRRIIAIGGGLLAVVLLAPIVAGTLLTRPVQRRIGEAPASLHARTVMFPSRSGALIHGWWIDGQPRKGVIVLLPGVRANRLSMVDRAAFLRDAGYSVLLIDFQATGESVGHAITFGWRERFDVIAAVEFAHRMAPAAPAGIIGTSLGGAAALLATPPLHVDALVLEAVYPTMEDALKNRLSIYLGRAGTLFAPVLLAQLHPRLGVTAGALRPIDHIAAADCPVLIIGGASDRHTTLRDTRAMFAAARAPKELWIVPGAAHVDIEGARTADYRSRVLRFFGKALAP